AERRLQTLAGASELKAQVAKLLSARNHRRTLGLPKTLADGFETAAISAQLQLELIRAEREYLHELLRKGEITDESRRLIERELDLEEASIFCNREANAPPL
ncbi:MAG: Na+/H+ antiporter, partial [Rhodoplanes sp.]